MKKLLIIIISALLLFVALTIIIRTINSQNSVRPSENEPYKSISIFPINDINKDASLRNTILSIQTAINKNEINYLIDIISDDFEYNFDYNKSNFIKYILNNPNKRNELYSVLRLLLNKGGVLVTNTSNSFYTIPYSFSLFPSDYDPYDYILLLNNHVPVFKNPDKSSELITNLNYSVVKILNHSSIQTNNSLWVNILTPNGMSGYIYKNSYISPIDWRIGFTKVNTNWKIMFLAAGD